MLVQITEGEAHDIVCNSVSSRMEAWRKLSRRFRPLVGSRVRNLFRQVVHPGWCSMDVFAGGLERWEEPFTNYERSENVPGGGPNLTNNNGCP
eukprot:8956881-Pyramimonas_sp.AAC.1